MSLNIIHDSLIENSRSLNAVIGHIRDLARSGKPAPKSSARYLTYLRSAQEAFETLQAAGHIIEPMAPLQFAQVVGVPAADKLRISWRGWFGTKKFHHQPKFAKAA